MKITCFGFNCFVLFPNLHQTDGILLSHALLLIRVTVFPCIQVVVNLSNVYPKDTEAPPAGVDDITKLSYLHEPGVLQNLATRYELNEIYVSDLLMIVYFLQLIST